MKEINFYKTVKFEVDDNIANSVQNIVDEIIVYVTLTEMTFTFSSGGYGNRVYYNFFIAENGNKNYANTLKIICYNDKSLISMAYDSKKRNLVCGTNPLVLLNTVKEEIYNLN